MSHPRGITISSVPITADLPRLPRFSRCPHPHAALYFLSKRSELSDMQSIMLDSVRSRTTLPIHILLFTSILHIRIANSGPTTVHVDGDKRYVHACTKARRRSLLSLTDRDAHAVSVTYSDTDRTKENVHIRHASNIVPINVVRSLGDDYSAKATT